MMQPQTDAAHCRTYREPRDEPRRDARQLAAVPAQHQRHQPDHRRDRCAQRRHAPAIQSSAFGKAGHGTRKKHGKQHWEYVHQIEQLFLNRNVPEAAFRELADEMKNVRATIKQMAEECPMLYDTDRSMGELAINSSDLGLEEE